MQTVTVFVACTLKQYCGSNFQRQYNLVLSIRILALIFLIVCLWDCFFLK